MSFVPVAGADLGGGCIGGAHPPPSPREMTCSFLIQLAFCKKKKTMWFIGVEVEQETSAPPPKKILDPPLSRVDTESRSGPSVMKIKLVNKCRKICLMSTCMQTKV